MNQLYSKSSGKPCGYVPFFLESLKCGGFAWSKPSLYRERWSVPSIKDKYYCYQFRTTENENNHNPDKKVSKKWPWSTGRGGKWSYVWTEDPLIAIKTGSLYLNNLDIMRKELSRDEQRKPTWKMSSFDYFPGAGFSLGGNHKQQSKGAGIQLLPNSICLVKILLCSLHLVTVLNFQAPIQPLLAYHPLDHLTAKGKEQFNSCLMSLLVWKSTLWRTTPPPSTPNIKNCTFKINESASE